MKRYLLTLALAIATTSAFAVDYTFEHKGAMYDLIDYLNYSGSDLVLEEIMPEGVKNGVFHIPQRIKMEEDSRAIPISKVNFWKFPASLKRFDVNDENPYFTVVDGVLYTKDMRRLLGVPHDKAASYKFPASVKEIGTGAFAGSKIKSIVIPEGVTSIDANAFCGCENLTKVTIPKSVTHISETAFEETPFFANLPEGMNYLGSVAFRFVGKMPQGNVLGIKDGTVEIAGRAVSDQPGLVSVSVPPTVVRIGQGAFEGCKNLCSVAKLNPACEIAYDAFTSTEEDFQIFFDGDKSRYFDKGDAVAFSTGFRMVRGIDSLPKFSAIVEMNKLLPSGQQFNADLDEIRFFEGGITVSDFGRGPKQTFCSMFGHEDNKKLNLKTTYYTKAHKAAKQIFGVYYVRFHISKTGVVSNASVTMPCRYKTNNAAVVRLIESLPPFIPAKKNGKPVDVWVNLYVVAEPIAGGFLYSFPY